MWIMNLGKPVNIPQLNEQMAIELGANLLGEGIIYILGAALLIVEYNRLKYILSLYNELIFIYYKFSITGALKKKPLKKKKGKAKLTICKVQ